MQHDKNTKNIEQIEKVSQNGQEISHNIYDVMDKFGVKYVLKPLDVLKRSGALISNIAMSLIILPFIARGSVCALFTGGLNKDDVGQKDSFYDLKNNHRINWRSLLYGIAKRFQILTSLNVDKDTNQIRALIIDDTTASKTGKHIERIGYVHDHVSGTFVLGYKILVSGYWDGVSFIPLDFSIHREKRDGELSKTQNQVENKKKKLNQIQEYKKQSVKRIDEIRKEIWRHKRVNKTKFTKTREKQLAAKVLSLERNKNRLSITEKEIEEQKQKLQYLENTYYELKQQAGKCGLKAEDYSNQFKKQRQRNTAGYKRLKETDTNKIDSTVSMIKRALRRGFKFEYVLTDSWFFCRKLLHFVDSTGKGINLVSMATIGKAKYKILPAGKDLFPKQIITLYKRKAHVNRTYKAKYIKFQAEYQGIRVVIFFINIGKGENWRLLVSTDLNIGFNKLMEVYKIRWTIEVFFYAEHIVM